MNPLLAAVLGGVLKLSGINSQVQMNGAVLRAECMGDGASVAWMTPLVHEDISSSNITGMSIYMGFPDDSTPLVSRLTALTRAAVICLQSICAACHQRAPEVGHAPRVQPPAQAKRTSPPCFTASSWVRGEKSPPALSTRTARSMSHAPRVPPTSTSS